MTAFSTEDKSAGESSPIRLLNLVLLAVVNWSAITLHGLSLRVTNASLG